MAEKDYRASLEEAQQAASLSGIELHLHEADEEQGEGFPQEVFAPDDAEALLREMGEAAFSPGGDTFAAFVSENRQRIRKAAWTNEEVSQMLVIGYKMGISAGSSACMNDLGALYYMGEFVEQDYAKAHALWSRSLALADNIVEIAQPAIRIAQLLISEDCEQAKATPDPTRALMLFQQAEIGLRIDIANGQDYYRKRLLEAIEGQQIARDLIDADELVLE